MLSAGEDQDVSSQSQSLEDGEIVTTADEDDSMDTGTALPGGTIAPDSDTIVPSTVPGSDTTVPSTAIVPDATTSSITIVPDDGTIVPSTTGDGVSDDAILNANTAITDRTTITDATASTDDATAGNDDSDTVPGTIAGDMATTATDDNITGDAIAESTGNRAGGVSGDGTVITGSISLSITSGIASIATAYGGADSTIDDDEDIPDEVGTSVFLSLHVSLSLSLSLSLSFSFLVISQRGGAYCERGGVYSKGEGV